MSRLNDLLANNVAWAKRHLDEDPNFFKSLAREQKPEFLWIGCSDSRVPAEEILGASPGEVFVHRNVANIIHHTDFNVLSVLQFAIESLNISKILVVGHFGCGGIQAAIQPHDLGLADNWLREITELRRVFQTHLEAMPTEQEKVNALCKANVFQQVANVAETTVVQQAWVKGAEVEVHGFIFNMKNGQLEDLNLCVRNIDEIPQVYHRLDQLFRQNVTLPR